MNWRSGSVVSTRTSPATTNKTKDHGQVFNIVYNIYLLQKNVFFSLFFFLYNPLQSRQVAKNVFSNYDVWSLAFENSIFYWQYMVEFVSVDEKLCLICQASNDFLSFSAAVVSTVCWEIRNVRDAWRSLLQQGWGMNIKSLESQNQQMSRLIALITVL